MADTIPQSIQSFQPTTTVGMTPVQFNGATTFQSPFFWLTAGALLGWWLSTRGAQKILGGSRRRFMDDE
jgi:hypothetical protein